MNSIFRIIFFIVLVGCASTPEASPQKMSQLQLQEQLQRFYTRFTERLVENLTNTLTILKDPKLSETSYRQYLLYDSEALKIVTGPYPEINMLDMLVFVKLSKSAVKEYWIPNVFHESGKGLLKAFDESEMDIEKIAGQLITEEQIRKVDTLVLEWKKHHANQRRVEKIRLAEFSDFISYSKDAGKTDGGFSFSELVVDTQGAISAVDEMVLVANRGIFLVQQLPFLVRLHSRILAMEMVDDFSFRFGAFAQSAGVARQAQESPGLLMKMEALIDGAYDALVYFQSSPSVSKEVRDRFHSELWFLGGFIILLAFLISAIWWGMAWLVKYRFHS
jgi:hypothetical protein